MLCVYGSVGFRTIGYTGGIKKKTRCYKKKKKKLGLAPGVTRMQTLTTVRLINAYLTVRPIIN